MSTDSNYKSSGNADFGQNKLFNAVLGHKQESEHHNTYAPGILPGSANQSILGDVYLRFNLPSKQESERAGLRVRRTFTL